MPTFNVFVSIKKEDVPDNFLTEASAFIAKLLGKPESYVTVRVVPDQMMCHGGSTEPCGSVQLMSLGSLGPKNKDHSAEIGKFLEEKLKIKKDRFYITFFDIARNDCGYSGTTFA
ncbi:macrophage migration inhibitory factor homolog [Mercenaria mercenaria]|uniref:macrophage migration inhibitory factor homolog n=1 Tax=Mercenaria mercenaria TaxID=6596 RepID=UPI00234FA063|nr:macrophage migration inhibitory factor homolog [Mercenaria mercenaria]